MVGAAFCPCRRASRQAGIRRERESKELLIFGEAYQVLVFSFPSPFLFVILRRRRRRRLFFLLWSAVALWQQQLPTSPSLGA